MHKTSSTIRSPADYVQYTRTLAISGILQASIPESPADVDGDPFEEGSIPSLVLLPQQCRPSARAMLVTGNSMDDGTDKAIRHGDIVLVDPQITYSIYHDTGNTVFGTRNGYIVKERGLKRGRHMLLSRNPNYPPVRFDPEWTIVGVVYAIYLGPKEVKWL